MLTLLKTVLKQLFFSTGNFLEPEQETSIFILPSCEFCLLLSMYLYPIHLKNEPNLRY